MTIVHVQGWNGSHGIVYRFRFKWVADLWASWINWQLEDNHAGVVVYYDALQSGSAGSLTANSEGER